MAFVPADFEPPTVLTEERFVLEPLGPQHNEADYAAWSSSMEHVRATARFKGDGWPREMTLDENRADLERHARDFAERKGFTYTVLDPGGDVIGCVYIYPAKNEESDAKVNSWVRESRAELDGPLRERVTRWLGEDWPFQRVTY
jgi:hypothetical protein